MTNTTNMDQQIDDMFIVLNHKKQEIEKSEKDIKKSWITNCAYETKKNGLVNIQTANLSTIQQTVAEILMQQDYQNKANELLGLNESTKIQGYTVNDWISDCVKRVSVLKIKTQKEQLSQLEKRLDGILSTDQKRKKEFEDIQKALKM